MMVKVVGGGSKAFFFGGGGKAHYHAPNIAPKPPLATYSFKGEIGRFN